MALCSIAVQEEASLSLHIVETSDMSSINYSSENDGTNGSSEEKNCDTKEESVRISDSFPGTTVQDDLSNVAKYNFENNPHFSGDHEEGCNENSSENNQNIANTLRVDQNSHDENDEPQLVNKKKRKRMVFINSDSEDENYEKIIGSGNQDDITKDEGSENLDFLNLEDNSDDENNKSTIGARKKRRIIINSDSEDENEANVEQVSDSRNVSEYESVGHDDTVEQTTKSEDKTKDILSALCDSESSDENNSEKEEGNISEAGDISESELDALKSNEVVSKSRKGKTIPKKQDKEEKMTAKKALEQRKEILAESQRRVRESRVSLPYHKPKPRSLKEFLQNRPKLAAPLRDVPEGGPKSGSLKMNAEQLKILSQKIKQREKELEEFYKSASESEHEEEVAESASDQNKEDGNNVVSALIENNTELNLSTQELRIENEDKVLNEILNLSENLDSAENVVKEIVEEILGKVYGETTPTECEKEMEQVEETERIEEGDRKIVNIEETELTGLDGSEIEKLVENETQENSNRGENSDEVNKNAEPLDVSKSIENISEMESTEEATEKKSETIKILSDILIIPEKSKQIKPKYNLDDELLELASEAQKVDEAQCDDYEFNLDGIEDDVEIIAENKEPAKKESILKKRLSLLEKLGEIKPRLSLEPNQVIDLENGIAMPDGISKLKDRFIQHNLKPGKHSQTKEMSITSVSDGKIHNETLAFKIGEMEDEEFKPLEKPGVRMKKLREELQHKMAQRRSELWKEKLIKKKNPEKLDVEDDADGKSECGEKDLLDDENEEDFTDPEEDDEELEEDDCDMTEKKQKKSEFVDEEAEESDKEDDENDAVEMEDENDIKEIDNESEAEDVEDEGDNEESEVEEEQPKKRVLKGIKIRPIDEDSDDEITSGQIDGATNKNLSGDNSVILTQPTNFKVTKPLLSPHKSEDHFATPVSYMTGIKNLNTSGLKFVAPETSFDEDDSISQSKCADASQGTQEESQNVEKNISDPCSLSTQDVLDICSGQFENTQKFVSSPEISTQQLREVFTGSMKSSTDFNTQDVNDICSGAFTGTSQMPQTQEKDVVLNDMDDHIISQLIDEDELENFKKKFESPALNRYSSSANRSSFEGAEEVVARGGVIDSDDDDDDRLKLKNKKGKRLAFSDDEDSSMSENPQEETIDLHDEDDLADLDNVGYDSEENEVDETEGNESSGEKKPEKLKASDFFEKEAELSESEWGSEDEDERNLDDLEFEKGDEEKFDEDQLRTDIEKIQMKQILDEDNREIKMLQELLLEDGELHGTGRQRQFRWKNIDAATDDAEDKKEDDDDDVYLDEEESEEQYRKERHKREMLKLKQQSQEEDSLIIESQSLSFTHKSLKIKSQNSLSSSPQVTSNEAESSPKIKMPFTLLNKRGSFLTRGEKILQKIAETSKVSFNSKNTNRIVFQTIDQDPKKRKASSANIGGDSTPVALKKLRLSGLSPALNKDKPKPKSLFEKILDD